MFRGDGHTRTFLLDDNGVNSDCIETLRGVAVLANVAGRSVPSESVSETWSARTRALEESIFLMVIFGRESEGNGKAGISDKTAEGEECNSGCENLGDRWLVAEGVLSADEVSSAFATEALFLPWLRSLMTPCSSTADLFGNLNGEGESRAEAWGPGLSGLPSFIDADGIASGRLSCLSLKASRNGPLSFEAVSNLFIRKAAGIGCRGGEHGSARDEE